MILIYKGLKAIGKGRPRVNTITHKAYTDEKTREFEREIRVGAIRQKKAKPFDVPVDVEIVIGIKPPKSRAKEFPFGEKIPIYPHTQKPDIDNVVKAILDALNGVCYTDDSLVCRVEAVKRWMPEDEILIFIYEFELEWL